MGPALRDRLRHLQGMTERPVPTPASLRHLLPDPSFRPYANWGQNFLLDQRIAARIVAALELAPGQSVLEIGPGTGSLTRILVAQCAVVSAIEIDRRLQDALAPLVEGGLRLVWADALAVEWGKALTTPLDQAMIVSNIPYAISGPLLVRILKSRPQRAVVMVQQEVADRLLAPLGHHERGSLTLVREAYADAELLFRVKGAAFWPAPTVTSAVVRLTPRADLVQQGAERIWTNLFHYRRKTIRRGLQEAFSLSPKDALTVLRAAGIDSRLRPQELSLAAFEALTPLLVRGED